MTYFTCIKCYVQQLKWREEKCNITLWLNIILRLIKSVGFECEK